MSVIIPEIQPISDLIENEPSNPETWFQLGTTVDELGDDPEEAAFYYSRAIALDPFNPVFHSALITLWIDASQNNLAEESLDVACDLLADPESNDRSGLVQVCVEAALHALHKLDLDLARSIIERVRPDEIKNHPTFLKASMAWMELQLMAMEISEGIYTDRVFPYAAKIPKTRLNSARYSQRFGD